MFIAIDGDNIGLEIERLIVLCQPESLIKYCESVKSVVSDLEKELLSKGGKIFLSGGDNILAEIDEIILSTLVYELFSKIYPLSFSVGTGLTMLEAYIALKTAKASGKGCWIEYKDLTSIYYLKHYDNVM